MRRLARDVLLMILATGISRVFGLGREVAVADRFGLTAAYDAFLIAFFLPHTLRQLFAEGALSVAFVPLYAEQRTSSEKDAHRFACNVISWLTLALPIVAGLGVLAAPLLVRVLAIGFSAEKLNLTVFIARIVFPFIILVGLSAVLMGILQAHRRFFAASLAPVWSNIGMILGAVVLAAAFPANPIMGLAVGLLVGGAGQILGQLPSLRAIGFRFRFVLFPVHPKVWCLLRRMAPAVLALAVTQINLLVDNQLASFLEDGGISALQYGMRLFQLPIGVLGVSVATALLPRFATAHATGDDAAFSDYFGSGLVASLFLLLPAMAGLLVVGPDLVRLLFEHGQFQAIDTARTTHVLMAYLVGLVPYGLVYVQTRASYALGRSGIPLIASTCAVAANVVLDLLLVGALQETGLALATAVAGVVNAAVLAFLLRRTVRLSRRRWREVGRTILGTLLVAAGALGSRWSVASLGHPAVSVVVPVVVGCAVYTAYAWWTGLWAGVGLGPRDVTPS